MVFRIGLLRFSLIGVTSSCVGCASNGPSRVGPNAGLRESSTLDDAEAARMRQAIEDVLRTQAQAWNEGDITTFMEGYWRSPQLSFASSGHVTRGWAPTLENYEKRYATRDRMGRLTFDRLEIEPLGPRAALVLGRWRLDRADPVGGVFTLIFRKIQDRWLITHDHTSARPSDDAGE